MTSLVTTARSVPLSARTGATRTLDSSVESAEQRFVLWEVSWESYELIAKALEGRHVRTTYEDGRLEFMSTSGRHGILSRLLGRFVTVLTREFGIPILSCGDMTCAKESALRALEPDECFYLENEPLMRGKDEFDLAVDPAPDLAIEVELSPAQRDRMSVYAGLGVPEVWRYDGSKLTVNELGADGVYVVKEASRYFPEIPMSELARFLELRKQMDGNGVVDAFRDWVRSQV
ncbi:MAG: Uma2 family endonuclease [Planctomycetaceae bacterium]|nr:Uma2 family endonuclease [Planctomycetaceae bacterium]